MERDIVLNIDRLSCIVSEMKRIIDSNEFSHVKINFTDTECKITPITETVKVVISSPL